MRTNLAASFALLLINSAWVLAQPAPDTAADNSPAPKAAAPAPAAETIGDLACPAPCAPKCDLGVPPPCGCWWVSADYLFYFLKPNALPGPLLVVGGPTSSNGIAGAPGTTSLGNNPAFERYGMFNGIQVATGVQVPDTPFGIEFSGFVLEQRTTGASATSDATGNPIVSFPFVNSSPVFADRVLAAFPAAFAGGGAITSSARLFGAEADLAGCAFCTCHFRGDWLTGFRYLNLAEAIQVQNLSNSIPPAVGTFQGNLLPPMTLVSSTDRFSTLNNFYGWQVGGRIEWHYKRLYAVTTGKVALGVSDEIVNVNGASFAYIQGATMPTAAVGGIYALPSNIGSRNRAEFAAVPELGFTVGYQLTRRLRIYAGYQALYWSSVVRSGDQVSPLLDRRQIPLSAAFAPVTQPTHPFPPFNTSDFWAQGVNAGIAFHF